MNRGGQPGNKNAHKGFEFRDAVKRALARYANDGWRKGLDKVADQYVRAAAGGDAWAMKDMADRLDGRPAQAVDLDHKLQGSVDYELSINFLEGKE